MLGWYQWEMGRCHGDMIPYDLGAASFGVGIGGGVGGWESECIVDI
jgi:hypothetical protein